MFFRALACVYVALSIPLWGEQLPYQWKSDTSVTQEETLFLRRIADFWQEGDYAIAKNQIQEFLQKFPTSHFAEPLSAAIGDLFLREQNYTEALNSYSEILSSEFSQKIFLNRMQCLYHLEWYSILADECEKKLENQLDAEITLKTTYYLAIALYHQCLNAQADEELSLKLAQRAEPYFEILLNSEISTDTAQAFAHLCCILKDFSKASDIYLKLGNSHPEIKNDMLFHAGLIQAEFDKNQALDTFENIVHIGGAREKEAIYNQMVLLFETKKYEDLIKIQETILNKVASEKKEMVYLFLGKTYLALKKYAEASNQFQKIILEYPEAASETLQLAIISLIEASFEVNDLKHMNLALEKLSALNPTHPEILKGRFSRALLFKKLGHKEKAREELKNLLNTSPLSPQTVFELAHLEYQEENWSACHDYSKLFITEFPNSELAAFAWRYLASSSAILSGNNLENKELKETLALDIELLLKQKELFSQSEKNDWQFFLSKTYFDLNDFEKARQSLTELLKEPSPFSQKSNAYLLLSICYRDNLGDLDSFCSLAERALNESTDLIEPGPLHISLFNAYLTRGEQTSEFVEQAAEHLYQAFGYQSPITKENFLWLGHYYNEQFEKGNNVADRTAKIYSHLLNENILDNAIEKEMILYKLSNIHSFMKQTEKQISLLNQLMSLYNTSSQTSWNYKMEAQFLLAEGYAIIGEEMKADDLYSIVAKADLPIRSELSAKACLQKAKLSKSQLRDKKLSYEDSNIIKILTDLKDLSLQKRLLNEPVHLEAALEYIHLKGNLDPDVLENKSVLFKKIKTDFESCDDLLSKDYHASMGKFPEKKKIYNGYIQFFDAEILLTEAESCPSQIEQKQLQAKAKDLLLEIIKEKVHPALISRATSRLQAMNAELNHN